VLDLGWEPARLVYDPFFSSDALDLWGYDAPALTPAAWRDGRITFAAEAKARVDGGNGLSALRRIFELLQRDPGLPAAKQYRRKWDELVSLTQQDPIDLLLVADGARWWFRAERDQSGALRLVETA
jgi:hypothetical protein